MQAAIGAGCDSGSQQPYHQLMYNALQVSWGTQVAADLVVSAMKE
jgi:hypothetical protein